MDAQTILGRLFEPGAATESWFTDEFLKAVPLEEVRTLLLDLTTRHGTLVAVEPADGGFTVRLERAVLPARITLDAENHVAGLWFGAPVPLGDVEEFVATILALPGAVGLLVDSAGARIAAHRADEPLAVGSAFKLVVIEALAARVAAGAARWDDVLRLDETSRSLPGGILQDWPSGSPLTLASLAALAVSLSDNTASDLLARHVGRAALDAASPRNAPFLTTGEAFRLKAAGLADAWGRAAAGEKRRMLAEVAHRPLPAASDLPAGVTSTIEWFLTAKEIAASLDAVHGLPAFRINPGLADAAAWAEVAFKGGSEPGVLTYATRLVGRDGRIHVVVATWNDDEPLDERRLAEPYAGLLRVLGGP